MVALDVERSRIDPSRVAATLGAERIGSGPDHQQPGAQRRRDRDGGNRQPGDPASPARRGPMEDSPEDLVRGGPAQVAPGEDPVDLVLVGAHVPLMLIAVSRAIWRKYFCACPPALPTIRQRGRGRGVAPSAAGLP